MVKKLGLLIGLVSLLSCSGPRNMQLAKQQKIGSLHFLGEFDIPFNFPFQGTTIGGLSGIDYDPIQGQYNLISDDRSAINPARFYSARINFDLKGIDTVVFTAVHYLKQADGNNYPNSMQDRAHTPDPEALRLDPVSREMIWTSEGERIVRAGDTVLEDPAITVIDSLGNFRYSYEIPANLHSQSSEKGPRQNGVFEGLDFDGPHRFLYVSVEEPLYEDGPRADISDNNPWIRILKYDLQTKKNIAQYAYKLDPVAHPASPASGFKINGIPDILWIGTNRFLILERSFSTGNEACTIKLFEVDLGQATNIINNPGLKWNADFVPARKKLLLNMDSLGIYIDNIEGITFGPVLPNGHRSLLFVSDNNFNRKEKTQFLLFEVMP